MIDLYAGLGGGSAAFRKHGHYNTQVEFNTDLATINDGLSVFTDILEFEDLIIHHFKKRMSWLARHTDLKFVFVWASPPCTEFSLGYNAPGPTAARLGIHFEPDMSHVEVSKRIIDALELEAERHGLRFVWAIENVRGAIKHFTPFLGKPRSIVAKFCLWGNFPRLAFMDDEVKKHKIPTSFKGMSKFRSNLRAKVPEALSMRMMDSVMGQAQLDLTEE